MDSQHSNPMLCKAETGVMTLCARQGVETGVTTLCARQGVETGVMTLCARQGVETGVMTLCQVMCEAGGRDRCDDLTCKAGMGMIVSRTGCDEITFSLSMV